MNFSYMFGYLCTISKGEIIPQSLNPYPANVDNMASSYQC